MAYEMQIILVGLGSWAMVMSLVAASGYLIHDFLREFKNAR